MKQDGLGTIKPLTHAVSSSRHFTSTSQSSGMPLAGTTRLQLEEIETIANADRVATEYFFHNGPPGRTSSSEEEDVRYILYLQQKERKAAVHEWYLLERCEVNGAKEDSVALRTSSVTLVTAAVMLRLRVTVLFPQKMSLMLLNVQLRSLLFSTRSTTLTSNNKYAVCWFFHFL